MTDLKDTTELINAPSGMRRVCAKGNTTRYSVAGVKVTPKGDGNEVWLAATDGRVAGGGEEAVTHPPGSQTTTPGHAALDPTPPNALYLSHAAGRSRLSSRTRPMPHGCPSPPPPNNPVGTPAASVPSPDDRRARPSGLFTSHESAVVFINGFGQGAGPDEGLYRLYRRVADRWYDRRRDLVLYRTWDSNHRKTSALIKAGGAEHIVLVGYSYGAGWGCTQVAKHLAELGLIVHQLFLIDPVPRYRFIPARIKSLTRGGVYVVPPTVRQVTVWQQLNKRGLFDPVGHEITWSKNTVVTGRTYIGSRQNLELYAPPWNTVTKIQDPGANHSNIDDDQAIHDAVINSITTQSPPPPRGPECRPCAA